MGRCRWAALGLIWGLVCTGAVAGEPDPDVEEATRLLAAQDYRAAAAKCGELTVLYPDYAWGWQCLGVSRWKLAEPEAAERSLRQAVTLEPDGFETRFALGRVLAEREAFADSAAELERARALAAEPEQRLAATDWLADSWFRAGEFARARPLLEQRVAADAAAYRPHYVLALTCRRMDDLDCAVDQMRAARALAPDDAKPARSAAELSAYRAASTAADDERRPARIDEALADAQVWVRTAPRDPAARAQLVEAYLRAERFEEAARSAEEAASQFPGTCRLALYAARARNRLADPEVARTWADRALACDPEDRDVRAERTRACLDQARALITTGELLEHENRIDTLLADAAETLAPSSRLASEAAAVEEAYRTELERQRAGAAQAAQAASARRCEELRVKLWEAEHGDGPALDAEERSFLERVCATGSKIDGAVTEPRPSVPR